MPLHPTARWHGMMSSLSIDGHVPTVEQQAMRRRAGAITVLFTDYGRAAIPISPACGRLAPPT